MLTVLVVFCLAPLIMAGGTWFMVLYPPEGD